MILLLLYVNTYNMKELSDFVKARRKQLGLTQEEFAEIAGVALTVIRKIEQGKENLSLAKVNQVLQLFGHVLGPCPNSVLQINIIRQSNKKMGTH